MKLPRNSITTTTKRWRVQSLLLLLLALHDQFQYVDSAGLRGLWRTNLMTTDEVEDNNNVTATTSTTTTTTTRSPAFPHHKPLAADDSVLLRTTATHYVPLVCDLDSALFVSSTANLEECPNLGIPICQYDPYIRDYQTVCVQQSPPPPPTTTTSSSTIMTIPQQHLKSYCGVCKKCFDTKTELQTAVDQYQSYRMVDTTMAETYGWPIGNWCVDKVTDFSHLFFQKSKFNENINAWETSQVTDLTSTFQNAYAFNQPLNQWDTSRVKSMTRTFAMAIHFDQDLSSWNVSSVSDMGYMFLHALEFNQDVSNWQVHNAYSLNSMFFGATKFHQDLSQWAIADHADTENMCQWK